MRFVTLLLLAAALAPSVRAQTDTTSAWRYFPLEVGNRWEYSYATAPASPFPPQPPPQLREYWRWMVTGTVGSGSGRLFVLRQERYSLSGALLSSYTAHARYDSATARVEVDGARFAYAPCPLDLPFYSFTGCDYGPANGVGYGQTVLGLVTSLKRFDNGLVGGWVQLAAGIGFVRHVYDHDGKGMPPTDIELQYARVGGRAYGTPVPILPVVVAAEPESPPTALGLRAAPNPVAGPLALTLVLPGAGPVTVEAFDVTGQRVYHSASTLAAGTHTLDVDAAGWAPGLYVVRVTTADGAATARIAHH